MWAYFIILEAGLTIVAVNLPSLSYFVVGVTPESVLRSIRSVVSLGSGRGSQGSYKSQKSQKSATKNSIRLASMDTNSSHAHLAYPEGKSVESHAMTDLPSKQNYDIEAAPAGKGNHSIERREEQM